MLVVTLFDIWAKEGREDLNVLVEIGTGGLLILLIPPLWFNFSFKKVIVAPLVSIVFLHSFS